MSECILRVTDSFFKSNSGQVYFYVATPETPLSWVLVNLPSRVRDLACTGTSQVQHPFIVDLLHTSHFYNFDCCDFTVLMFSGCLYFVSEP